MSTYHKLRDRFTSFWTDSAVHHAKSFRITGMVWCGEEEGMNPEPRFNITFDDGETFSDANAEEIFEGWATPDRLTPTEKQAA